MSCADCGGLSVSKCFHIKSEATVAIASIESKSEDIESCIQTIFSNGINNGSFLIDLKNYSNEQIQCVYNDRNSRSETSTDESLISFTEIVIASLSAAMLLVALFAAKGHEVMLKFKMKDTENGGITGNLNRMSGSSSDSQMHNLPDIMSGGDRRSTGSDFSYKYPEKRDSNVSFYFPQDMIPNSARRKSSITSNESHIQAQNFDPDEHISLAPTNMRTDSMTSTFSHEEIEAAIERNDWRTVERLANIGITSDLKRRHSAGTTSSNLSASSIGDEETGYSRSDSSGISSFDENAKKNDGKQRAKDNTRKEKFFDNETRAKQLDELMEAGDWKKVAQLAQSFSTEEDNPTATIYSQMKSKANSSTTEDIQTETSSQSSRNPIQENVQSFNDLGKKEAEFINQIKAIKELEEKLSEELNFEVQKYDDIASDVPPDEMLATLKILYDKKLAENQAHLSRQKSGARRASGVSFTSVSNCSASAGSMQSLSNSNFEDNEGGDLQELNTRPPSLDEMARHSMSFGGNTFEERDSNSAMSMLEVSDNVSLEQNLQSETTAPGSITQDGSQSSNESDNLRRRDLMPFYSTRHLSPSPPSPPSPPYKKRIVELIQQVSPEDMQNLGDILEAFSGEEEFLIQVLEGRLHEVSEKNDDQISEENTREIKAVHSKVQPSAGNSKNYKKAENILHWF